MGIGAQFGGKYYCHDVRVIRLLGMAPLAPSWAFLVQQTVKLGKINKTGCFWSARDRSRKGDIPDTLETDVSDEVVNVTKST